MLELLGMVFGYKQDQTKALWLQALYPMLEKVCTGPGHTASLFRMAGEGAPCFLNFYGLFFMFHHPYSKHFKS
eukprot:1157323-Pelagomonas_calceolata.AAC.7